MLTDLELSTLPRIVRRPKTEPPVKSKARYLKADKHDWIDVLMEEVAEYEMRLRAGPEAAQGRSIAIGEKW